MIHCSILNYRTLRVVPQAPDSKHLSALKALKTLIDSGRREVPEAEVEVSLFLYNNTDEVDIAAWLKYLHENSESAKDV